MLLRETEMAECPGYLNSGSSLQREELVSCSLSTPHLAPEAWPGKAPHHPPNTIQTIQQGIRDPLGNAGLQARVAAGNRRPYNISLDPFLLGDVSR